MTGPVKDGFPVLSLSPWESNLISLLNEKAPVVGLQGLFLCVPVLPVYSSTHNYSDHLAGLHIIFHSTPKLKFSSDS